VALGIIDEPAIEQLTEVLERTPEDSEHRDTCRLADVAKSL
jgi:hypothetical protein